MHLLMSHQIYKDILDKKIERKSYLLIKLFEFMINVSRSDGGDDDGCDGTNGRLQLVRYQSELVLLQQLQEQLLQLLFQLLQYDFSSY